MCGNKTVGFTADYLVAGIWFLFPDWASGLYLRWDAPPFRISLCRGRPVPFSSSWSLFLLPSILYIIMLYYMVESCFHCCRLSRRSWNLDTCTLWEHRQSSLSLSPRALLHYIVVLRRSISETAFRLRGISVEVWEEISGWFFRAGENFRRASFSITPQPFWLYTTSVSNGWSMRLTDYYSMSGQYDPFHFIYPHEYRHVALFRIFIPYLSCCNFMEFSLLLSVCVAALGVPLSDTLNTGIWPVVQVSMTAQTRTYI